MAGAATNRSPTKTTCVGTVNPAPTSKLTRLAAAREAT
jgi:hypothetical protein